MHIASKMRYWESWSEELSSLRTDVELSLEEFAPYGREPAKGASAVIALLDMLSTVSDFASAQNAELQAEEGHYYEACEMFRAWKLGLCPDVMKEARRHLRDFGDAGNSENWEEISGYLRETELSRDGTQTAIELWHASKYEEAV